MSISNYDKFPIIEIGGNHPLYKGWPEIFANIKSLIPSKKCILLIECYHGTNEQEINLALFAAFPQALLVNAHEVYKSESEINHITFPDVTEDRIFGRMTSLNIENYIDEAKLKNTQNLIAAYSGKLVIIFGIGACIIHPKPNIFIYADMARWKIQQRMRAAEVANIGVSNFDLEITRKYKRAYFVDWRICDRIKKKTFSKWDFIIDTNEANNPKMINAKTFKDSLENSVKQPFRVVPFFDPGVWGGQWLKSVCDLDTSAPNYAWGFDCVPEENSVLFKIGSDTLEFPASNIVFFKPKELLGKKVFDHFGDEFPIRFDFLDTMDGGNLSLQVHPMKDYIKEHFGMDYTQDESYYILDAGKDTKVYLGLNEDVKPELMIRELHEAQKTGTSFDAEKHVTSWPAKKHDHFLIPAGTVHCSGSNSLVLEISATPYIFTFKLWDWDRLGMDGIPRPINIERGEHSIQWDRTTNWTRENLVNHFKDQEEGPGWKSEKTGLHDSQFIETIRHWFKTKVPHDTEENLNVLNLVQGKEAIVESPTSAFAPFIVHYAETFIVPANVGKYTIRPYGEGLEDECATIKAYIKN